MMYKRYNFIWICVTSFIPHAVFSIFERLKVIYIQDICNANNNNGYIKVRSVESGMESSGILKLSRKLLAERIHGKCDITLIPPNNLTGITISLYEIYLGHSAEVTISDGITNTVLPNRNNKIFGKDITISSKLGNNVTISFTSTSIFKTKLKMIYTAYYEGVNCLNSSYFKCDNGHCISEQIECDGYNHCGDYSYRKYCYSSATTSNVVRVVIIIIVVVLIGAILAGIFWFYRKRLNQQRQEVQYPFAMNQAPFTSPYSPYGVRPPYTTYPSAPPVYMAPGSAGYQSLFRTPPVSPPAYVTQVPQGYQSSFRTAPVPPPAYGTQVPPPTYGTQVPPPAYGTQIPPPAYGTQVPPGYQPPFTTALVSSPAHVTQDQPGSQSPFTTALVSSSAHVTQDQRSQ